MSLRLARLVVVGFGAVSLAAAVNMLVLESARTPKREARRAEAEQAIAERARKLSLEAAHPAPPRQTAMQPDTAAPAPRQLASAALVRVGQHEPSSAELPPTLAPVSGAPQVPAELVRALQRELKRRGYEPGSVDGTLGDVTRAAIMAYEHDQGLTVDGAASDALLQALRTGRTAGLQLAAAPNDRRHGAAADVTRMTQESLARLGYQVGAPDGQMSEATEKAIRDFEKSHNLVPSGRISGELILRLVGAVSAASARRLASPAATGRRR